MPKIPSHTSSNGELHTKSDFPAQKQGNSRIGSAHEVGRYAGLVDLAKVPNLIAAIQKDFIALGIIGEQENSLLEYFTGTSRLLDHPIRIISRGPSSSGKSHRQNKVSLLFPTDAVIHATHLTPQALYYGEEGWLKHKFLVKGERSHRTDEDGADSTAALRQLISEDRICKQVTMNVEGKLQTVTIEQEGPIAFSETTTAKSIFAEDLNRCLQVYSDDSSEQTKRILASMANEAKRAQMTVDGTQQIIDRHRKFQESLQPVQVVIPYAPKMVDHLPTHKLEVRRTFKQMLSVIKVIAFLHQFQRLPNANGCIEATADDYKLARRLLLPSLNDALGVGSKAFNAYQKIKPKFPSAFNSNQLMEAKLFNNKMTRDRTLKLLVDAHLLEVTAEGKAKTPARYAWTGYDPKPILPENVDS
jgi:hypothetical protein